jgi:hypothetical protein
MSCPLHSSDPAESKHQSDSSLKFGSPGKSLRDLKDRVVLENRVINSFHLKKMQEESLAEEAGGGAKSPRKG